MSAPTAARIEIQDQIINRKLIGRLIDSTVPVASRLVLTTAESGPAASLQITYDGFDSKGNPKVFTRRMKYNREPLSQIAEVSEEPVAWVYDNERTTAQNNASLNQAVAAMDINFKGCNLHIEDATVVGQTLVSTAQCPVFYGQGIIQTSSEVAGAYTRMSFESSVYDPEDQVVMINTQPAVVSVEGQNYPVHRAIWTGDLKGSEKLRIKTHPDAFFLMLQTMSSIRVKPKNAPDYSMGSADRLFNFYIGLSEPCTLDGINAIGQGNPASTAPRVQFGVSGQTAIEFIIARNEIEETVDIWVRPTLYTTTTDVYRRYTLVANPGNQDVDFEIQHLSITASMSDIPLILECGEFDLPNEYHPQVTGGTYVDGVLTMSADGTIDMDGNGTSDYSGVMLNKVAVSERKVYLTVPDLGVNDKIVLNIADGSAAYMAPGASSLVIENTGSGLVLRKLSETTGPALTVGEELEGGISSDWRSIGAGATNWVGSDAINTSYYPANPVFTVAYYTTGGSTLPPLTVRLVKWN